MGRNRSGDPVRLFSTAPAARLKRKRKHDLRQIGERLQKVYGDQAYNGVFAQALAGWSIDFEKASRPESAQGFVPVAKRWVVEPVRRCGSIAWTNFFRRIVKDYEYTISSSVSWLHLANIQIMLQRI